MAPVAVNAVGAVSGDLQRLAFACTTVRVPWATPVSTVPQPASSERLLHRGPRQARRDVHIVDGSPEQSVANEAAHAPCLPSGLLDDFQSIMGDKRKGERLGKIAPEPLRWKQICFHVQHGQRPFRQASPRLKAAVCRWRSDKDAVMCWGCGERES